MEFNKRLGFAVKMAAVVAVVAGVATAGFEIKEPKASASLPSGKCGFLLTRNYSGMNSANTVVGTSDRFVSATGVVDFDAGASSGFVSVVSNFGNPSATTQQKTYTGTVSVAATTTANVYLITQNITVGSTTSTNQMYAVATNGGNTMLLSSKNTGTDEPVETGVCQAL